MAFPELQKLLASDGATDDRFGNSVAIDGEYAIIGAPFDDNAGGANAGAASQVDSKGAAYVFERSGETWSQTQKLTASDGAADDEFGTSVSIDGQTIAASAPRNDAAESDGGALYVFARTAGTWSETRKLITSGQAIAPATFVVYVSVDGGAYAAQSPVTFGSERLFMQTLGTHSHGQRIDVKVAAVSTAGDASALSAIASLYVDTVAPDAPASIELVVTI